MPKSDVDADFIYDSEQVILKKKLKEGLNVIQKSKSGNLELNIEAVAGKVPKYVILGDGKPIKTVLVKKKTTCWECGVDENGDRHCWKVPCPVIIGPWNPGKPVQILK